MMAGFKVMIMSFMERAMSLAEQFDPLWVLPAWLRTMIMTTVQFFLAVASVVAIVLYRNQNSMLYHPEVPGVPKDSADNPAMYRHPGEQGMPYIDVTVETEDKVKLHCWFIRQPEPTKAPTLIFFQENAGNMGYRLPSMKQFYTKLGVNVFMVSYRGYGRSEGTPTEEGLQHDGQAVMDHIWARKDVDNSRLLVLGRSLGGAVSVYVTEKNPEKVKGMILENTFTSIPDMVDVVLPLVAPLKSLVLRIGWKSIDRIRTIKAPILFISGRRDNLVPPAHMDALQAAAKASKYTVMHKVHDGEHNDTWQRNIPAYTAAVKAFMVQIGAIQAN